MFIEYKISVITACYNNEKTIIDTIESILNQSYNNIELVIIDGNSTDKTVEIIKSFQKEFINSEVEYKWVSERDSGIYDAWNKALEISTGDWMVFIGADDFLKDKNTIENIIPYLNKAKKDEINFVYGKIEHINSKDKLVEVSGKPWVAQKDRFTYNMNIGYGGSFVNRSLFDIHGKFNDSFKIAGDYEFLLRELKDKNKDALFVNEIILVMREGGVSANLPNRLKVVKETKRARKINELTSFSKELFMWEMRVLFITYLSRIFGSSFAANIADFYRSILGKDKRWSN